MARLTFVLTEKTERKSDASQAASYLPARLPLPESRRDPDGDDGFTGNVASLGAKALGNTEGHRSQPAQGQLANPAVRSEGKASLDTGCFPLRLVFKPLVASASKPATSSVRHPHQLRSAARSVRGFHHRPECPYRPRLQS